MFSFFFVKTVDTIIADIAAKIEHLHQVADKHLTAMEVHEEKISQHSWLRETAAKEAERARRLAYKFTDLIS